MLIDFMRLFNVQARQIMLSNHRIGMPLHDNTPRISDWKNRPTWFFVIFGEIFIHLSETQIPDTQINKLCFFFVFANCDYYL